MFHFDRSSTTRRRLPAAALALTAGLVLPLVGTSPAVAHAGLTGSTPGDGKTVAQPPAAVSLRFTEDIQTIGLNVQVTSPAGSAASGAPVVKGDVVTLALKPGLPAGAYQIRFQVVSADGHPIAGKLRFTAAAAAAAPTTAPPTTAPTTTPTTATPTRTTVSNPPLVSIIPTDFSGGADDAAASIDAEPTSASSSPAVVITMITVGVLALLAAAIGTVLWRRRPS